MRIGKDVYIRNVGRPVSGTGYIAKLPLKAKATSYI